MDLIVPIAVELVASKTDLRDVCVRHLDARLVGSLIQLGMDSKAGGCSRGGNQTDDDLQAGQGLAAPVLADEGKQPVFNLVPLAGSGREMAYGDPQLDFVREFCSSVFHNRRREPLLPPESAVINSRVAC